MLYKVINPVSINKPLYDKNNGYKITGYEEIQNTAVINDIIDSVNYRIPVGCDITIAQSHAHILVKKYSFLQLEEVLEEVAEVKKAVVLEEKSKKGKKTK